MTPLEAAFAVADDLGLAIETPTIISEGFNLVVHLAPFPIVARVPTLFDDPAEARTRLTRDLLVSAHASALGHPSSLRRQSSPQGHMCEKGGSSACSITLPHEAGAVADPEAVGASLRALHESLAGYTGPLPPFDPLAEPIRLLAQAGESSEASFLLELRPSLEVPDVPGQAVHGDASYRNVLVTPDGPRWIDLETALRGPVEWDLAEVVTAVRAFGRPADEGDRALVAYGAYDPELLERLVDLRAFQHACFIVWYEHRRGSRRGGATEFVDWLRRRR